MERRRYSSRWWQAWRSGEALAATVSGAVASEADGETEGRAVTSRGGGKDRYDEALATTGATASHGNRKRSSSVNSSDLKHHESTAGSMELNHDGEAVAAPTTTVACDGLQRTCFDT
ncbi:hypothetical protein JG687_00006100 [Phytophthora cactorum]|uniref:Uncharacterized protein n=1 Tax=Phytophthora cactorum TaxID=29920 RepID=A0A329T1S6_9STRA|nr:hypothetical protein Pcac1_g2546 [Phytophthora cactorum]KAG2837741.1 hypothetical protein PC112_g4806 [Phytophthora cactorum]KAG2841702.1 hypothetical protein PC111_g2982 [Phytophthora cactorum]KAG2869186.1 hypothetical protein PC113_g372 [Phytophthora cactorum]KAG2923150.1 hypothetical protein PC114_g4888 [Phytophthora cactorum]